MFVLTHLWIIPLLPLLGAAVNGIFGRRWPRSTINGVALGSTGLSFLAVARSSCASSSRSARRRFPGCNPTSPGFDAGNFRADYALQVDQLTLVMLLVVTGVGWLIHLYSTGYMADDAGYRRFFAYLNLFMFFMLTLVLAANYLLLFVGWEGVGLCSYLLVGFWFLKKTATDAGNKAFWVNRVGDFGFLLGMFLLFRQFGTLDFARVFRGAAAMPVETAGHGVLTAIALAAACRRHWQIGADSALRLAARRHGRPHAGQRADSRGHHGGRRRIHGRALARYFPARAHRHARRRRRWLR